LRNTIQNTQNDHSSLMKCSTTMRQIFVLDICDIKM
jgi:hypothetical protein